MTISDTQFHSSNRHVVPLPGPWKLELVERNEDVDLSSARGRDVFSEMQYTELS